jgi:hypothetical protein
MDQQFNRDMRGNESRLSAPSSLMGTYALVAVGTTTLIGDAAGADDPICTRTISRGQFRPMASAFPSFAFASDSASTVSCQQHA